LLWLRSVLWREPGMASKLDKSKVVVVLEDDDQIRGLLAAILQENGYYTVPVETGLRALEVLQQVRARLLVLDVTLPDMPGSRVVELLLADEKTRDIPVMVLSGHLHLLNSSTGGSGNGHVNGRDQVLMHDPFEIEQVVAEVEKMIGKPFVDDLLIPITGVLSPRAAFGKGAA
jgi:CheY-like chemotaxis protein